MRVFVLSQLYGRGIFAGLFKCGLLCLKLLKQGVVLLANLDGVIRSLLFLLKRLGCGLFLRLLLLRQHLLLLQTNGSSLLSLGGLVLSNYITRTTSLLDTKATTNRCGKQHGQRGVSVVFNCFVVIQRLANSGAVYDILQDLSWQLTDGKTTNTAANSL